MVLWPDLCVIGRAGCEEFGRKPDIVVLFHPIDGPQLHMLAFKLDGRPILGGVSVR